MSDDRVITTTIPEFFGGRNLYAQRKPASFELEITARCNSNCRHCYINLPADDAAARSKELSLEEIDSLAGQAVELGAVWCLLTGGEPLLRHDFEEIYLLLKRKGLLVSLFTNATLINEHHIRLFGKYPPREIEITVYGVTEATVRRVMRRPGMFKAFERGLGLLTSNRIPFRLKAMALRSNLHELREIAAYCRQRTKDYYRFDPLLHLRYDGNPLRNEEIRSERLTAQEIVQLEEMDPERMEAMIAQCDEFITAHAAGENCRHLFHCGAGTNSFLIGHDGRFRLCSSLNEPSCQYDLRTGTLAEAWHVHIPRVRALESQNPEFLEKCRGCQIANLCLWCPAHAHLEHGALDSWSDYFCEVAHARAEMLKRKANY